MKRWMICLCLLILPAVCHATTYATWITIWYGRDQAWWSEKNPDATRNLVKGQWKTLDWCDESQISDHLDGIKAAGVTVVIADLTNGWNWLDGRCQLIQKMCAEKGMKFCVAENSGGNTASFEAHAKDIWDKFAGPDAPHPETYFHYRGKPLIVCYSIRDWYRSYLKMGEGSEHRTSNVERPTSNAEYRSKFSLVWASGEDSCINKWGWQLEPWVGVIPSGDSMFVTPAVRWNPADGAMWRKSMAWLDYNFALARKSNPAYVIVGGYDDPTERNGWLVSDTAHCELGRQVRGRTGALNPSALYDRVREWTSGKPSVVPGGVVRDGAYRIVAREGLDLGIINSETLSQGAPGAVLGGTKSPKAPFGLFWFYHLGNSHYRIIAVHSGLALEASDGGIIQTWDSADPKQRWTLARTSDGFHTIRNDGTGQMLSIHGIGAVLDTPKPGKNQHWRLKPELVL